MGGSGSGKSTLLKHLIGLKPPARGTILFDGEDFGAADEDARKGDAPPHGRALPERRAVERADAGGERGAAAGGVHELDAGAIARSSR
jgi:energy-coupling factor transporter ATP-binding protein EcfA2